MPYAFGALVHVEVDLLHRLVFKIPMLLQRSEDGLAKFQSKTVYCRRDSAKLLITISSFWRFIDKYLYYHKSPIGCSALGGFNGEGKENNPPTNEAN